MIAGLGIDITELARVKVAIENHPSFIDRILTTAEQAQAANFHHQRKVEYIAGRWSLKESFSKAMGTGISKTVGFLDLEILDNELGQPIVTKSPYPGPAHVSVSHTKELVMTEVILERNAQDD
ncbi:holo-ACP synthase [Lactobacillus sp. 3B(2020)]|uniref:holo-ACP synthase n=1 Tax=Lactobacillus sp. 3B(2020) TaxID=2695882 RepID=UPI0015DECFE0|nr:holo-ACP synthase [Lactobacillus sp. 3B(2020)]QLL69334.1 holo-ACP synthase [Lactobacillus sp. 3B(2020)]